MQLLKKHMKTPIFFTAFENIADDDYSHYGSGMNHLPVV